MNKDLIILINFTFIVLLFKKNYINKSIFIV